MSHQKHDVGFKKRQKNAEARRHRALAEAASKMTYAWRNDPERIRFRRDADTGKKIES